MRGVTRTAEERKRIVAECRRSGLSTREFAERTGIPTSTLYQWVAEARTPRPVPLARVVRRPLLAQTSAASLLVELEQARLHIPAGFDRPTLAAIIDLLASPARRTP